MASLPHDKISEEEVEVVVGGGGGGGRGVGEQEWLGGEGGRRTVVVTVMATASQLVPCVSLSDVKSQWKLGQCRRTVS